MEISPVDPSEKTPFLSPRNVPLWAGLVLTLIVIGLIVWLHGAHG